MRRVTSPSPLPRWKRWWGFWVWVLVGAVFALLILSTVDPVFALLALLLPCLLAFLFGSVEVMAPRRFLEWRDAVSSETGWQREAAEWFDQAYGLRRQPDGRYGEASVRRIRLIGGVMVALGLAMTGAVLTLYRTGVFPA